MQPVNKKYSFIKFPINKREGKKGKEIERDRKKERVREIETEIDKKRDRKRESGIRKERTERK